MIKILFVDDDAIARKSIKLRIPWKQYGWNLMYCARDGVDALDYMQNHRPNIIITDIKMPVMDGIQMSIIAKDYYPDVKFIFISSHKDFEYAQQALKLNAVDYLTKPIITETLVNVLNKTEEMIIREQKLDHLVNEGYPALKRHYVSQLMFHNFTEVDDSVFKAFDINLNSGYGVVGFMDFKWVDDTPPKDGDQILQETCTFFSEKYPGSFFISLNLTQIFFIYTTSYTNDKNEFTQKVKLIQEQLQEFIKQRTVVKISFCIGSAFQNLNDLYLSYQSAVKIHTSQSSDVLMLVQQYIKQNYANPSLTLIQIANQFNINHCYLTSLYKEKFGINLYDYLIQVRMEKAADLLRTTSLKSYEIAEKVGYNNSQYFSLSFKKYYNCTVTEFKAKNVSV